MLGENTEDPTYFNDPEFRGDQTSIPVPATYEHLARLVFLSYRYSQGGIGTQNRMLLYIENHYHPDLFGETALPTLKSRTSDMVSAFFLNEKTHPATAVPWENEFPGDFVKSRELVTNELAGLFDRFIHEDLARLYKYDPQSIAMSIITMDADYLTRIGGRAGNSIDLKIKVSLPYLRDPYDSMFIKHGVLGVSTQTIEFDDIFRHATAETTIRQLDTHTLTQLQKVIEIYISEHIEVGNDKRLQRIKQLCEGLLRGER